MSRGSRRRGTVQKVTGSSSTTYTYYNKTFDDITDLFIFACAHGNYILVYKLLQEGEVQADSSNKMGKSALQLAIENEHYEVVKILLDYIPYEQFRDALLLAIYLDHTKIADFILNHPTYLTFAGGFLDPTDPYAYDDSQFSSDMTPLILAAQHNRLPIVHHLLAKGERIKKPHEYKCACTECTTNATLDSFRQAQMRLSAYTGLASEVYIALVYPDPILQAFQLRQELRKLAKIEHHFCAEYRKLAEQLAIFVARLLDNVRGHEELEIVLSKAGLPHEEKYESLARFDLAIQCKEKPFVAHSNCQQKLMEKWYENLGVIKNANYLKRGVFYLAYILAFPFLAMAHYMFPKSRIGSLCQQPNLKFKAYIVSYFTFIALIVASSYFSASYIETTNSLSDYDSHLYENYINFIYRNTDLRNAIIGIESTDNGSAVDSIVNCDLNLRFLVPNAFQIVISIWVIGFSWGEFKQIVSVGLPVYLKVPSNYVDCAMNMLYVAYFIFLYSSIIFTRLAMNTFQSDSYWTHLARYHTMSDAEKQHYVQQTRHVLYWLNADRFYWNGGDLHNLAEAFFAMGNVVSICRMCFLLPIIPFVGPLQVMLDRMMIDISKWIGIILICFVSFACALYLIFSYFAVALQQQSSLLQSVPNGTAPVINSNVTLSDRSQCPPYFYELLNQSLPLAVNDGGDSGVGTNDSSDFCQQASDYDVYRQVGFYPAVYSFGQSFQSTVLTMFFTMFGAIGTGGLDRGYELLTGSCYQPDLSAYLPGFDAFTSNLGFIIYGLFTFMCVTVLINTLIAMLERTIEDIDDRADIEWKFARSKLYMEYIRSGGTLPVPMNILPSPASIISFLSRIKRMIKMKKFVWNDDPATANGNRENHFVSPKIGSRGNLINTDVETVTFDNKGIFNRKQSFGTNKKLTYKLVMERVIKRFLLYYKDPRLGLTETKEALEIKEIRNDISALHFELANDVDSFDEMGTSMQQSMKELNKQLNACFDLKEIKQYLNNRAAS